ncbi:nucleoside diphosphate kinase, putative [Eimeria necatrix]|uniref:nucleoside-diphosphate kinase n=1 Tax=Eimeria necatrix TaxID=51315 RepID=U6N257_9EIME|nr:nucleoside diphosphate kinase, putative [Eimeria necatrix]CDJ70307.1 nucleoside diphosphate kinase, putative [Eimeria necatrix]
MSPQQQRTYIMLKPDGLQRGLLGEVLRRFEQRGFTLVALKLLNPSSQTLEQHYAELRDKPFFRVLMNYMSSGPVVAMVWQGTDVVKQARKMLGETRPLDSQPGRV